MELHIIFALYFDKKNLWSYFLFKILGIPCLSLQNLITQPKITKLKIVMVVTKLKFERKTLISNFKLHPLFEAINDID